MKQLLIMLAGLFLAATPALAQDYRIKAGDMLRIEVLEDSNLNRSALVLPDGRISLPLAGTVQAGGRTIEQLQADLAGRLAPNFAAAPNVFVGVDTLAQPRAATNGAVARERTIAVYMLGEAANPGRHDIKRGSTLLQALAASGGFSQFAATNRVQLRRGAAIYTFNYRALESGAAANPIVLQEGDVIVVPQRRLFE